MCVRAHTHTQSSPNLHELLRGLRLFPLIYFLNPSKPFPQKVFTRCLRTTRQNSSKNTSTLLTIHDYALICTCIQCVFISTPPVSLQCLPEPSTTSSSNLLTSFHSPLSPLSQRWPSLPECGTIHCRVGDLAENTLLKNELVLSKAPQLRGGAA